MESNEYQYQHVQAGFFNGNDGECIYALPVEATTGTKICRLNNVKIYLLELQMLIVSNGTSCIAKTCSSYKTITAYNQGGLENSQSIFCAFTPTRTDKINGTCKIFSTCTDANKDKLAYITNPSCKWTENSTGTSCVNHTCDIFATGIDCQPIPSFDGVSSIICILQSGKCVADPGIMTDSKICYTKSAYSYIWNVATNKCESIVSGFVNPNNSNGTNNQTVNLTTTESVYILSAISFGIFGLMA